MTQLGEYRVIYKERASGKYTNYICRRPGAEAHFLAIVLPGSGYLEYLIPYVRSCNIDDFIEYFSVPKGICMIFSHMPGIPFDEISEAERTRLLKPFLETIIHKKLTNEYIMGLLYPDRVLLTERGEIHFIYAPPDLSVPLTDADICKEMARFMESLWPAPPDEDGCLWLDRLKSGKYANLCAAYRDMPEPAAKIEIPEKRISKLTAFIERLPGIAAAALAVIGLITAAMLYFTTTEGEAEPGGIKMLGDIVISKE